MSRAQQRAIALSTARFQLRHLKANLLEASAQDAHQALDDYARQYPDLVGSQWYLTASESELSSFYRDWRRWQRQQRRLLDGR
jgi:hypothetical protein